MQVVVNFMKNNIDVILNLAERARRRLSTRTTTRTSTMTITTTTLTFSTIIRQTGNVSPKHKTT